MIHLIRCALILALLVFGAHNVTAEILLQEDFEGDLNLTTKWQTGHPKFVYPKDGILYLNQGKSGGDYVSLRSVQHFDDMIIYYEWFIIEWSGQGDGGGALRQTPDGSYWMRWWGRNNVKVTTNKAGPVNAWQPFPAKGGPAQSNYDAASDHFILKAALMTQEKRVTIHIWDITDPKKKVQVAEWEVKDDTYKSGNISFDCWKFGIYGVDNVVVATPEHEEEIFADNFDPQKLAIEPEGKLAITWGDLKSSGW